MFIIRLTNPTDAPRVLELLRDHCPFQSWPTGEFGMPRAGLALLTLHGIGCHIAVPPVQGDGRRPVVRRDSLDAADAFAEIAGMTREEFELMVDLHKRLYDKNGGQT